MRKRDINGRLSKRAKEDDIHLTLIFPSFKTIIIWLFIIFILFPWLHIISKFIIFQKIEYIFESLLKEKEINEV